MTYRELARRAGYSASALSAAASGQALPTLDVMLAYVGACGADTGNWQRRWQELSVAGQNGNPDAPAEPGGEPLDGQVDQSAPVTVALKAPPKAPPLDPPERGKRHRKLIQPVHFGLAPIILATAAIITYSILNSASHHSLIITRPTATAPQPAVPSSSPVTPPRRVRPTASVKPQVQPTAGVSRKPVSQSSPVQGPLVRFDFEQPDETWGVFWGGQVATGEITSSVAYRGTHSYQVTITGATESKGYSAFGVDHGLTGLHAGMRVTVHLRSSNSGATEVRFFAMNFVSGVVWAPQNATGDIPLPPGSGWSTMTWTVPAVDQLHAIGIQFRSSTDAPLVVAIDDISW
jgi:transcriptional regulator with XRE-family HTH domain